MDCEIVDSGCEVYFILIQRKAELSQNAPASIRKANKICTSSEKHKVFSTMECQKGLTLNKQRVNGAMMRENIT